MLLSTAPSASRLRIFVSLGLSLALLAAAQPAAAQYRARLSRGLESRLADGASSVTVLITAPQSEVDRLARTYGLRVSRRLDQGAVLSGTSAQIESVAGDANVGALAEDDRVISTMAVTTQSTGASLLWAGSGGRHFDGLTGQGVGVAVIDSGIAPHPDVVNRLALSVDFTSDEGVADGFGHGTHLAGIIAGSGRGSQSAKGTALVGMAPGASLISLRVLGSDGTGYVSDVIRAIEWAVKNKDRYKIRVLNLSLGHAPTGRYQDDPMAQAVERAVASGLVVVASAGNLGKTADGTPVIGAIVSPGYTPGALTVGALNTRGTVARSDDTVATYSSRGPVGDPDDSATWEIKPDLVAPGNGITAAGQPGTLLWDNFPERQVTGASGGTYLTLSGASMSTAVVSGAVAQLLQLQPKLTPGEVKFALQFSAERLAGFGIIEQGAGSLNVPLAAGLVKARGQDSAPASVLIGGEMVPGGRIAFGNSSLWTRSHPGDGVVWGTTIIWGNRVPAGNSTIWGSTIIWGNRRVNPDTIIWGNKNSSGADGLIWGSTIIWGNRDPRLDGSRADRRDGVGTDTIIWGNRSGATGNAVAWGNTIIWGNRGGVAGDTSATWGGSLAISQAVAGSSATPSAVWANTIIWGNRGLVSGDTIIWGNR